MLQNAKELRNYSLRATDGEIGRVKDFLFDDRRWTIRYLVVETGTWLQRRRVLLAPEALGAVNESEQLFPIDLSKEEVRHSPSVNMARPITQQSEAELRAYYGWPSYYEPLPATDAPAAASRPVGAPPADPHLFSIQNVTGYQISAIDGDIGHLADFLIDEGSWDIAYLVVDTRNWLPGRHVLLDPEWIDEVDWPKERLSVDLMRDVIKASPPYDASRPASAEYAAGLHAHYGRAPVLRTTS